ncbi:MAG: type III-A CRISPR-associated RAMP protein Csm4 [Tissierellia bacterium]|nr:type III-A CRISPR-associated RAMP protein Csm4 [Tissierellia bacterium]
MKYKCYRLTFPKGLRMGKGRIDTSEIEIPGDVLFSAILNEASKISGQCCERIIEETRNGNLLFTDAFPYIGEEYFLPKPYIQINSESGNSSEKKEFKKLNYIPLSKWEEFLQGRGNPMELNRHFQNFGKKSIDTKIFYSEERDHEIYNLSYFRFHKGNGLYFILGFHENQNLIYDLLKSIGYTGIGGKKSIGLGRFTLEERPLPKTLEQKLNTEKPSMLLSTSMATKEELEMKTLEDSSYMLTRRGGFIHSEDKRGKNTPTSRKKAMHFFKPGSIFKQPFQGDLFPVDYHFVHPIYRYGKPFWMEVDIL